MAQLLVLSSTHGGGLALPALELLSHRVRQIPAEPAQLVNAPSADVVFVDARHDLVGAKSLCKILGSTGLDAPLVLIVTEGGLTAVSTDWGIDDVILATAGPAEIDARVRLAIGRVSKEAVSSRIQTSGITIDESSYSAKVHGRPLDLTYKEFQLLHFFATHPSRVFTREQLLSEVWGYDYFGGTRTVDVHVRRLRAKLGDLEQLIGTVRNVGYRFNVYEDEPVPAGGESAQS
ncbi:response regulator transcription factor [Microbacterium arborescens]|uniref:response regulator transcription factor n=1 Tax=Microbacterium arborescens TaxID=33883 RepID=UPI0027838464|nr:response regulator transcription factor [Microbacterium arborescens]MDQ1215675.1 DNA-binding response OmpR family regulator [Microbacterium arborescens]